MTLTIRSATVNDSDAISALITDCICRTNLKDYPADVIKLTCKNFTPERVLAKMQERDTFVAFNKEVLVATVGFSGTTLHTLFVNPMSSVTDLAENSQVSSKNACEQMAPSKSMFTLRSPREILTTLGVY